MAERRAVDGSGMRALRDGVLGDDPVAAASPGGRRSGAGLGDLRYLGPSMGAWQREMGNGAGAE